MMYVRCSMHVAAREDREPFDAKGEKYSPAAHCQAILHSRWKELSTRAKAFWKCLSLFHSKAGEVAESVPNMPHTNQHPGAFIYL